MIHFKLEEFNCKCGCNQNNMQEVFIKQLNKARDLAGIPFIISSGFRCPGHNKNVGGKSNSAHLRGYAADILCSNELDRLLILRALIIVGFRRIGISSKFIHVDCDPELTQKVVWLY